METAKLILNIILILSCILFVVFLLIASQNREKLLYKITLGVSIFSSLIALAKMLMETTPTNVGTFFGMLLLVGLGLFALNTASKMK